MSAQILTVDQRIPPPARKLQALVQQLLKVSKAQALHAIQQGYVRVNGRVLRQSHAMLKEGDRVEADVGRAQLAPIPRTPHQSSKDEVVIVYEDEYLLVAIKPAALLTVPTPYRERKTLISLLERMLRAAAPHERSNQPLVYCVHRLDRGVSGLLVFGKQLEVAQKLRDQFARHKPRRRYIAIVDGHVNDPQGTFRSYLATAAHLQRYSTSDPAAGELAITHYRVVRHLADATQVEVQLETGRRNQIRVHFAEAGHPVLGDTRYGPRRSIDPRWPHRRLALHAEMLGFEHPISGKPMELHCRLPAEMNQLGIAD